MINLALVGCGGISAAHRARFDAQKDRMKVVATVDPDLDKARAAAEQLGASIATTDYREVLDKVDAALLALPHHLHHPIGMDFLNAGVHVLMEKPLANSEEECQDLIAAADKNNVKLMTAYCMRYHPLIEKMHELIVNKTYGETFQISIWTEQFTKFPDGHWGNQIATLGGGQFFSHGCHYVDLLLLFLGEPVRGTHLGTRLGTPWMEGEGTSHVAMEFESGAIGYHGGTWGARGTRLKNSIHVHCTDGMIEFTPGRGELLLHCGATEDDKGGIETIMESDVNKPMEREMEHFLDCIETGKTPITDGRESLQSLRVIWRMYEAEQNNVVADLRGLGLADAK